MRFYSKPHQHGCGIDLHAKTMYICMLDREGNVLVHQNLPSSPEAFLEAIAPYREDLVVAVECIFTWYWLADLCAREGIAFVLGHALYMKAIHGGKAKNDRLDALKIATLLRGGMLPQAYVYPAGMRATRDLLRRRLHLVRKRGQLLAHIQMTSHPYNLAPLGKRIAYPSNREGVVEHFEDRVVKKSIAVDLALLERYDVLIKDLELYRVRQAKQHDAQAFHRLRTIPGVGKILALTILYEIHDVHRFDRVQEFSSYARLVKCAKESAGKKHGTSGAKMGNVHLKWAFSEAAVLFVRHSREGKKMLARLEQRFGKGKALSILAHKLGRAAYFMLARERAFD
ncbi:MAG TPA: IS110 family transposase, partial [Candidatus Krumholzibacteria bacterium]